MIECYFKQCEHHPKDEPFCGLSECVATDEQIIKFRKLRLNEMNLHILKVGVFKELERAIEKFPTWPTDPLHALAILGEEFGELNKAMLQFTYEPGKTSTDEIKTEAIQTAAMALRLIMSLNDYKYAPSEQHVQGAIHVD